MDHYAQEAPTAAQFNRETEQLKNLDTDPTMSRDKIVPLPDMPLPGQNPTNGDVEKKN